MRAVISEYGREGTGRPPHLVPCVLSCVRAATGLAHAAPPPVSTCPGPGVGSCRAVFLTPRSRRALHDMVVLTIGS